MMHDTFARSQTIIFNRPRYTSIYCTTGGAYVISSAGMSTEEEAEAKAAFALLRPVCVEVMRAPSVEALRALDVQLACLPSLHPHLVDYVALPLRTIIKRTGSSNMQLLEATLQTLSLIFSHVSGMDSWEPFEEVFVFSCMLLDDKISLQAGYTSVPEDLILVINKMLRSLLLSLAESTRLKLYSHLTMVGHCVSVLLGLLHSHESKDVRKAACSSLLALTGLDSERMVGGGTEGSLAGLTGSPNSDHTYYLRAIAECVGPKVGTGRVGGSVFASFLPGITMSLSKLVTVDTKVGQSVTSLAVLTWAHYVCLVMADENEEEEVEDLQLLMSSSAKLKASHPPSHTDSLEVVRSRKWRTETDQKLSVLVQRLASLLTHEAWRVRLVMVQWSHCLLTHCHRTLVTCMPTVLEVLVTLTNDDYPQVSGPAHLTLEMFSQHYTSEGPVGSRHLTAVLVERLHTLASALPRLMRQHDDTRKLSTLQLLAGYLKLLGPRVTSLVNSYSHLSRLMQAIVQTLQLEVSDVRIIEQPLPSPSTVASSDQYSFPLWYQHFRSERIEMLLHHICQLLGFYGSLSVLIDYLMDMFQGSSQYRKEITMVICHILLGAVGQGYMGEERVREGESPHHHVTQEHLFCLVEGLLEEFVSPEVWTPSPSSSSSSYSHEANLLSCLLLRAVATFAQVLGPDFVHLLQVAAYPLLQKLGDNNVTVSSHALHALRAVCSHSAYSSIEDLITRNADYLVNSIALKLRSGASQHPEALQVLQAVLTHGERDVLSLMTDSVDELLLSLDLREDPSLLWPTLLSLTKATSRWAEPVPHRKCKKTVPVRGEREGGEGDHRKESLGKRLHATPEEVRAYFLDYHRRQDKELLMEDGEGEVGEVAEEEEEGEIYSQTKRLPPVQQAAVDVLQRCTHHLSLPSPSLRLTVLDSMGNCLRALEANEHTLLPEVHKVWPAFLPRLSDSSPVVALRAWEVLHVMGGVCGDFLRRRVVKEVWPHLITSLEGLAGRSRHAEKLYRQTADFKLQRRLLEDEGAFCSKMNISPSDVELLAHACFPYLSSEQPPELQQACKTGLISLIQRDSDRMWLLLQQLLPQPIERGGVTTPPHSSLKPYKFPLFPAAEKFTDNVQSLIQLTM